MERETLKLLLSHHTTDNYDRCLKIPFLRGDWYVCTRCFGLYTSFIVGGFLLLTTMQLPRTTLNFLILFSPLPAFFDWYINQKGYYRGNNLSRLITGLVLGLFHASAIKSIVMNWLYPLPYLASVLYLGSAIFLAKKV